MEKYVINIGRQLGSGGKQIAEELAKRLGIKCYDKRLLDMAAKESGFAKELFEQNDENKSLMDTFMHMRFIFGNMGETIYENVLSEESLFQFQSDAIRKCAEKESCIFLGRCADYILRDHPRAVSIFIAADEEERVRNVCEREGVDEETAKKMIKKKESTRSSYYNYYTNKTWGAAASYDLCINISKLGYDKSFELILAFVKKYLNLED